MDFISKHWAAYPRQFPARSPLVNTGDIREKDHRVRTTFNSCNFSFILRGRGDFHRQNQVWSVQAPCVITQWPGESLDYGPFVPDETWDELYLIYDARNLSWFRQQGFVLDSRPIWPIQNLPGVMAQVEELRTLSKSPGQEQVADRVDRVCERLILESLLPGITPLPVPSDVTVMKIANHLRRQSHLAHDLDALARRHGMSASTLRRRWFEALKITPGRYLLNLRLQQARRLLVETTLPIGEVANRTGFEDMFYFSRRFKLETQLTPSEYRRRYRMGLR